MYSLNKIKKAVAALLVTATLAACSTNSPAPPEPEASGNFRTATVRLPGHSEPTEVTYEIVDGLAIFEGDIILGEVDEAGRLIEDGIKPQAIVTEWLDYYRWPRGVIPYEIGAGLSDSTQREIIEAIRHWEKYTPINFVGRSSQQDYIEFRPRRLFLSRWQEWRETNDPANLQM